MASSRTTLPAGTARKLTLTLTAKGLKLLRSRHTLKLTVRVTISGRGRATIARTLHVTVKLKAKKKAGKAKR